MDIYSIFIQREGQKIRLPVNPEELPTVAAWEPSSNTIVTWDAS